jgi:membrane protein DedA with SNARE-associated domain
MYGYTVAWRNGIGDSGIVCRIEHRFSLMSVLIVAVLAAIVGDNLGYLADRFIGLRLTVKYGRY